MKTIILLLLSVMTLWANADDNVTQFQKNIEAYELEFTMPKGYRSVAIKENRDLSYDFAIKNEENTMEVRYSIFPLKSLVRKYKQSKNKKNEVMVNPNNFYSTTMQTNILNMTGGALSKIGYFPERAVQREFNADIGGSSFFKFKSDFGKGYVYGQAIILHKENVADVIITYLSNDKKTHAELSMIAFYALVFKNKK